MTICTFFENFTDDNLFSDHAYGTIFKPNDLVVVTYQGRQTLGKIKFEIDIEDFKENSIYLNRDQRRDLALLSTEEITIPLEIRKGNLLHAIIYFFEGLSQ
jgi:hypothetical protein